MALNEQIRIAIPDSMKAELLLVAGETGHDVSELVRACVMLALPTVRATPGIIPLCQPGILRTSPSKG